MKTFTAEQLATLADIHGFSFYCGQVGLELDTELHEEQLAFFVHNVAPGCIEATEFEGARYGGFRYVGPAELQHHFLPLINALSDDGETGAEFTPELAEKHIGCTINVYYITNSGLRHDLKIIPREIVRVDDPQIGQSSHAELIFTKIEEGITRECNYIYEWQGVFRVTGSAHVLYFDSEAGGSDE